MPLATPSIIGKTANSRRPEDTEAEAMTPHDKRRNNRKLSYDIFSPHPEVLKNTATPPRLNTGAGTAKRILVNRHQTSAEQLTGRIFCFSDARALLTFPELIA